MATEQEMPKDDKEISAILGNLLDAVRECQRISTVTKEILTEANSCVSCLCQQLEIALSHGLRKTSPNVSSTVPMKFISGFQSQTELCFWNVFEPLLTKHEIDRFCNLNNISTNVGKGRAWLRCSLNEHSLERMLQTLLGDIIVLQQYYTPEAFLRNDEKSSLLPQAAAGLKPVVFCIKIDDASLDKISPNLGLQIESKFSLSSLSHVTNLLQTVVTMDEFPEAAALTKDSSARKEKTKNKKKRKKRTVISFDDRIGLSSNSEAGHGIYDTNNDKLINREHSYRTMSSISSCSEQSLDVSCELNSREMQRRQGSASEEKHNVFGSIEDGNTEIIFGTLESNSVASRYEEGTQSSSLLKEKRASPATAMSVKEKRSLNTNSEERVVSAADTMATLTVCDKKNKKQNEPQNDLAANHPLVKENAELQKALVVLLQRKDELVEDNKQMQIILDANDEQISALKMEVDKLKGIVDKQEANAKLDNEKNSRENDVLKNQLKRYVETVHTLQKERKNSRTTSESDGHDADSLSTHSNAEYEVKIYEEKLSNVAQMHGELLEFTENLHTRQISAISLLRKMHDELVSLRGPMPTDDLIKAIEGDPSSPLPFQTLSMTGPIVNVWVPSAFMQGSGPESYHVYQVYICIGDDEWNIYRRYSDFLKMHTALCKVYPQVSTFNFPPKKNIGNKSTKFVEERRKAFQTYLRKVMNNIFQSNVELKTSPKKKTLLHILPFFSDSGDQCRVLLSTGKQKKK